MAHVVYALLADRSANANNMPSDEVTVHCNACTNSTAPDPRRLFAAGPHRRWSSLAPGLAALCRADASSRLDFCAPHPLRRPRWHCVFSTVPAPSGNARRAELCFRERGAPQRSSPPASRSELLPTLFHLIVATPSHYFAVVTLAFLQEPVKQVLRSDLPCLFS